MSKYIDSLSYNFNFKGVGEYKGLKSFSLSWNPSLFNYDYFNSWNILSVVVQSQLNIGLSREPIAWLVMIIVDYIRWAILLIPMRR